MFCKSVRARLKALLRQFNNYINDNIDVALQVTTNLKAFIDSPIASFLTAIIPGDLDNAIKARLEAALLEVIPVLTIVKACEDCVSVEDKLRCFAIHLQSLPSNVADAVLHKLAALLAAKMDDNKLPQHLYDLYTQGKYSVKK